MKDIPRSNSNRSWIKQKAVSLANKVWGDISILWKQLLESEILHSEEAEKYFVNYFDQKGISIEDETLEKIRNELFKHHTGRIKAGQKEYNENIFNKTNFLLLMKALPHLKPENFLEWEHNLAMLSSLVVEIDPNILDYFINLPDFEEEMLYKLDSCWLYSLDQETLAIFKKNWLFTTATQVFWYCDQKSWKTIKYINKDLLEFLISKFDKTDDKKVYNISSFVQSKEELDISVLEKIKKIVNKFANIEDFYNNKINNTYIEIVINIYSNLWTIWRTVEQIEAYVLPYFEPSKDVLTIHRFFQKERSDNLREMLNFCKDTPQKFWEYVHIINQISEASYEDKDYIRFDVTFNPRFQYFQYYIENFDTAQQNPNRMTLASIYENKLTQSSLKNIPMRDAFWIPKEKIDSRLHYLQFYKIFDEYIDNANIQEKDTLRKSIWKMEKIPMEYFQKPWFMFNMFSIWEHIETLEQNPWIIAEYFELFGRISQSESTLLQNPNIQDKIMSEIILSWKWHYILDQIEESTILNNNNPYCEFPMAYQIFNAFQIFNNKTKVVEFIKEDIPDWIERKTWTWSKYLRSLSWKDLYKNFIKTFYIIFMKISISSANDDLIKYIEFLQQGEIEITKNNSDKKLIFHYLQNIQQLLKSFVSWHTDLRIAISRDNPMSSYYAILHKIKVIWKTLNIQLQWETILENIEKILMHPLWLESFQDISKEKERSMRNANIHAEELEKSWLHFEQWDLIKWVSTQLIESYFENGMRCPEWLWEISFQDWTWFDADLGRIQEPKSTFSENITSNIADKYTDWMFFIIKNDTKRFVNTEFMTIEQTSNINLTQQDELVANHFASAWNYSILWWFWIDSISAIVLKKDLLEDNITKKRLIAMMAKTWRRKPIYNMDGICVFWKSDFDSIEKYWKVLNWEFPEDLQLKINKSNILHLWVDEIFDILESYPEIKQRLAMDVWVVEWYTLWEHTKMWLTQFDKYIKWKWFFDNTILSEELFVAMYLYHDGGKPLSIIYDESDWQHAYTKKNIWSFLKKLWFSDPKEIVIASEIACQDIIGDMIRWKISQDQAYSYVLSLADKLNISPTALFTTMKIYAMVDWSSYTTDAWWKQGYGFDDSFDFSDWTIKHTWIINEQVMELEKSLI